MRRTKRLLPQHVPLPTGPGHLPGRDHLHQQARSLQAPRQEGDGCQVYPGRFLPLRPFLRRKLNCSEFSSAHPGGEWEPAGSMALSDHNAQTSASGHRLAISLTKSDLTLAPVPRKNSAFSEQALKKRAKTDVEAGARRKKERGGLRRLFLKLSEIARLVMGLSVCRPKRFKPLTATGNA